jgi:DNA primase
MRAKLLDLHEAATAWFEEQMRGPEGALAREYLAGRGLSDEGIKKFRIGYAPDGFNALRDRLSGMADEETLRSSGLFSSKKQEDGGHGRLYDRFRKRVVFPVCNEGGRVIAFTARTLGVAAEGEKAGPKYINSPETPLYSKGQVLFNLDKAKTAIRTVGFALLVEGQMDCISVFLRGIQCYRDQRDRFHRAAGGDPEAPHVECDRQFRSRCGWRECGGKVDLPADRGGFCHQAGHARRRIGPRPIRARARRGSL